MIVTKCRRTSRPHIPRLVLRHLGCDLCFDQGEALRLVPNFQNVAFVLPTLYVKVFALHGLCYVSRLVALHGLCFPSRLVALHGLCYISKLVVLHGLCHPLRLFTLHGLYYLSRLSSMHLQGWDKQAK